MMTDQGNAPSPEPTAEDCWRNGVQAAQGGDAAQAERWFGRCAALQPNYPNAALNAGSLAMQRGDHAAAEPLLRHAVTTQPTVESISAWAGLLEAVGQLDKAQECFHQILKAMPAHSPSLRRLGELAQRKGDRAAARNYYRQARNADPDDVGASVKYAIASWEDDPAETAAVLDQGLVRFANDDLRRASLLSGLLIYKEFHERLKRGLMPYHATSLDELFFTFTAPAFADYCKLMLDAAEKHPKNAGALIGKFIALFCSRDRRGAQEVLDAVKPALPGIIWETVTFDPAFYRMLESFDDQMLVTGLPPVSQVIAPAFDDAPVAYLSCNHAYFTNFCVPMLRSLADRSPGAQVHIHIMDISEADVIAAIGLCGTLNLRVGLSVEQPGVDKKSKMEARCYYHAIRFIRYYHHLKHYGRTLWLMDVDALFNRDPQEMYQVLGAHDAAMRIRAGRFEPWNQFNACIVAATLTPASVLYFRLIAAYIAHFFQRGQLRWGIDQLAMYGVFEYLRDEGRAPTLTFLDDRAINYDYRDDGIVWCNSGGGKFFQLKRNPDGSRVTDDPDRAKYLKLFDKYYVPAKA